jgi:tetratricopeptide (TPR) repeat protein
VGKFSLCLAAFGLALLLALGGQAKAASGSDYILLGNEAAGMNNYEQALIYYTQAINAPGISSQNRAVAYNNRAGANDDLGNSDAALRDFAQAIALDPSYDAPYYGRSFIYEYRGDYDRAIADMRKALSLTPSDQDYKDRLDWLLHARRP